VAIGDVEQSLANLKVERDAILLYDALAEIERDPRRAAAFRHIVGNERRHASIWADKLRAQGAVVPPEAGPRLRVRIIISLARLFGTKAVGDLVQALEGDEEEAYGIQPSPEVESIAADERRHAEIWRELEGASAPDRSVMVDQSMAEISARERWHRSGQTGTLRATIFGVNDGLVSNLALVMGVAGAASGPQFILLAGIAGLLAGAFSMAAGEWISMQSQRELFERQIALERAELAAIPEEEEVELALVYRRKGFGDDEAKADRLLERLLGYRVFADAAGKMNLSVKDIAGGLLLVPQFTLAADTQKGMRASLTPAAPPQEGERLFGHLLAQARRQHAPVESGIFGADMQVTLTNDGPVTFWLES